MERKNDWIAALINRPDFTMVDMYANDIKPENTGLQDKDYYKEIPQVREKFTNDKGQFDEKQYDEFYDSALRMYNAYTDGDFLNKMIDNIERSPFDWTKIDNPHVQDVSAVISASHDPYRHSMGLRNLYDIGDPQFSIKEVAQANFVRDENGNKLDWTPNDKGGLIKGLFRPTLYLAQYEEDTTETDEFGNTIVHKAGDYKLDPNGNPYYQELGSEDPYGKQILNYSDTFTVEGTKLNKWDPFDSDGINKSIGSTLSKTVLKLSPFLFGPTVGAVAGTAYALFGLASVMPVLGKMVNGIFSSNDTDFGRGLTKWESYMERFAPAKSESGSNSFWNFENLADIIATSASQLYSQRQIANIPKWLSKGNESIRNSKIGQQLALGYMATTSAQDTYSSYIEAGANEELAGIASLATMGAFYGLMSQDYWKRHMFGGSWLDENATMYRRTMQEWSKQQAAKLNKLNPEAVTPTKWYKSVYNKVTDFLKNNETLNKAQTKASSLLKKSGTETAEQTAKQTAKEAAKETGEKAAKNSFLSSSADYIRTGLNEGIEETMEEATTDLIKGLSLGLEALGVDVTKGEGKLDFGFSAQDFLSRYTSAFVGGTIGGMVFEGLNKRDRRFGPQTVSILDKDVRERLIWLELNGYGDKMKQWVEREYRKGNLGNKNLSSEKVNYNDPNSPFKPGTDDDNQNLLMKNILLQTLDQIEYDINNFAGTLVYSDLYKTAVEESEKRAKELRLSLEEYAQKEKVSPLVNTLLGMGVADNIMDDFVDITNRIVDLNAKINKAESEEASKTIDSDPNHSTSNQYIRNLIKQRDELVKNAEDIKKGKNLDQYLEQVFFAVSPELANFYINPVFGEESKPETSYIHTSAEAYTKWKYGLDYNSLSQTVKDQINDEFKEFKGAETRVEKIRLAQRIHSTASQQFKPVLESLNTELKGYKRNQFFAPKTIGEFTQSGIDEILKNTKIINDKIRKIEIENPDYLTDPDWTSLNAEREANNARLARYEQLTESPLSRIRLGQIAPQTLTSEEIQDDSILRQVEEQVNDLSRTEKITLEDGTTKEEAYKLSDDEKLALISTVKDYYQYLVDNKIVNNGEDPLNAALNLVYKINPVLLQNLKNSNLNVLDKYVQDLTLLTPEQKEILWTVDEDKSQETFEEELANNPDYYPLDWERTLLKLNSDQLTKVFGNDALLAEYVLKDDKSKANTRLGKVIPELEALSSTLQSNPFDFNRKLDEIKSRLPEIGIDENQLNNLVVEYLFGGNKQIFDSTLDLIDTRNKSKLSSAYDLIKNVELQINGQNSALWDVLQREEKDLYSKKSLQEYVTDDFSKNAFRYGLQIVNLLIPQVSAAVNGGFNSHINDEKLKLGKKDLLPIVDMDAANIILDELEHIASKLRFMLHLVDTNQDSQWREQQDAGIHTDPMYVNKLLTYSNSLKEKTKGKINLQDIWDKVNQDTSLKLTDITDQNYNTFYKVKTEFESEVFKLIQQDRETKELFKDTLVDIFGSGSLGTGHSEYSKSLNPESMTSWDVYEYLKSIAFADTKPFLSIYKAVISADDNKYVPFTGQEFIIRQMYARVKAFGDYRDLSRRMAEKFKSRAEVENNEYLKNRSILDAFLFVDGNSAVGKSSAIAYTFRKILEAEFGTDVQFRGLARFDSRYKNLEINLHLNKDTEIKTVEELVNSLWPKDNGEWSLDNEMFFDLGKDGEVESEHRCRIKRDFVINKDSFFNGGKYKVLVFDEVTLANEGELQVLNKWAQENGILIIGLGNKKQNAWQTRVKAYDKNGNQAFSMSNSGIEDCIVDSTPILKASLRTQNEGKRRNKDAVEAIVSDLWEQLDKNPSLSLEDFKYDPRSQQITLINYEDNINGEHKYYGEHLVSDDSILQELKAIKEKNPETTVMIVADDEKVLSYDAYKNLGFIVRDIDSAQGDEADYVFVDHDFLKKKTIRGNPSAMLFFRDFYTMITRSKQATFIKAADQSIFGESQYNIKFSKDSIAKSQILSVVNNTDVLNKFRAWRLDLLKDIDEFVKSSDKPEDTTSTESESSSEEPSGNVEIVLPPQTVNNATIISDKEHWINSVNEGLIRGDNAEDYKKRNELIKSGSFVDIDKFINDLNGTIKYLKYNSLKEIDENFDDKAYTTFISYLSLGISRYFYDKKTNKNIRFDPTYLTRYRSSEIPESTLIDILDAISNAVNNEVNFIVKENEDDSSTVFLPITIDGTQHVLPVFQINQRLNGFVPQNYLNFDQDRHVKSIAISSSGNTFIPLVEAAKNKAFVLDGALLFKPDRELACDINNGYFRRNNAGTSNKMILDIPVKFGDDENEIQGRFQVKVENGIVTSFVNTSDARLVRANVRAKDFETFWNLVKAKYIIERGIPIDEMSEQTAENILDSQYGDVLNHLKFTKSVDQSENAANSSNNNKERQRNYRILNKNSLVDVTSALLYWFDTHENDEDILSTWKQLVANFAQADFTPEFDSGYKYQNAIFFGFRNSRGVYSRYAIRRKSGDNNSTKYEFTDADASNVLLEFETDNLSNLTPKEFFSEFLKRCKEAKIATEGYTKDAGKLVQFDPNKLREYLQNGSLTFGLFKRGVKDEDVKDKKKTQHIDEYYFQYDTDLLDIFRFDRELTLKSQELMKSFNDLAKSFNAFKYGIFLNVASNKAVKPANEEIGSMWSIINTNIQDKFVTDIIDVIAPLYGINIEPGAMHQPTAKTELEFWSLVSGEKIIPKEKIPDDEVQVGEDLKYNTTISKFSTLDNTELSYLGKSNKGDHWEYYLSNKSGTIITVRVTNENNANIENSLNKAYSKQNIIGYAKNEFSNGVIYEEEGKYYYYEANQNFTIDNNVTGIEVNRVNKNGTNVFITKNGNEIENVTVLVPFNIDVKTKEKQYYYNTGSKIKFNVPLEINKSYLEKYTSSKLDNINSEFILIDSIKDNIITTNDESQILIINSDTFLNDLSSNFKIPNNENALQDILSNYIDINDSNILSKLKNTSNDLNKINEFLSDISYDIGVLITLDEDWNVTTQVSDDIVANYLSRKIISLKNQINSVYLEDKNQNGPNKRVVIILNDESVKTYRFKTNDFNFKNSEYYKSKWEYEEVNNTDNSESFTSNTIEQLKKDLENEVLFNVGDAQDIRTYLKLLFAGNPDKGKYWKLVKELLKTYKKGDENQQAIYRKYDEFMSRWREINDSNNKKC